MKRILIFLLALSLAGPVSFAQEERRMMTMEEAVLGRGLMVQSPLWHWTGDKSVVALDEPAPPSGAIGLYPGQQPVLQGQGR